MEGEGVALDVIEETAGGIDRLQPTVRTALFRIAQEAINNAARHAQARCIQVTVKVEPGSGLRVEIRDDGRGMPAQVMRRSGLSHLQTRAELIGADLEVSSDAGTCVTVTLPGVLT